MIRSPLEFNAFLHTPKTIVEIAEAKELHNLKLVELVLETLAAHNILKREGAKYKWQGYDFKVTENESAFTTHDSAIPKFFSVMAENLPRTLEGDGGSLSFPLVAWDAFFSSNLLKLLFNQVLMSMKELFPEAGGQEVIVDLFAGTGWSTIYLAEEFHPKKLYATGFHDRRLLPIAQENISIVLEDPLATAIDFLPTSLMESPIKEEVDLIFGFAPFQWTPSSDWLQLAERIHSLLKEDGCVVGFQWMRENHALKSSLPLEPLFAGLPYFTMIPAADRIQSILMDAGFSKPILLCNNFFFAQKQMIM